MDLISTFLERSMTVAVVIEVKLLSLFRTIMGLVTLVLLLTIAQHAVVYARRFDMKTLSAALVMYVGLKSLTVSKLHSLVVSVTHTRQTFVMLQPGRRQSCPLMVHGQMS